MTSRTIPGAAALLACLALLPISTLAQEEEKAWVVTMTEKPSQCLSSVAIRQIDGREKIVSPQGFSLEPGLHTMSGTAKINTTYCRPIRGYRAQSVEPLEAEFEAGKVYYVGYDHSSSDRNEWALVIWKVEDRNSDG